MIFKVCGMRDPENIRRIDLSGADWMGFVFYPRRRVGWKACPHSCRNTPGGSEFSLTSRGKYSGTRKGVRTELPATARFGIAPTTASDCKIGDSVLSKRSGSGRRATSKRPPAYEAACSYFLFDTKTPAYGGSGKTFDWTVLDAYRGKRRSCSAAASARNTSRALKAFRHDRLVGYDLNSRFEQAPGIKDVEKITRFIQDMKCKK